MKITKQIGITLLFIMLLFLSNETIQSTTFCNTASGNAYYQNDAAQVVLRSAIEVNEQIEVKQANDSLRSFYFTNDTIYIKVDYAIERKVVSNVYIFNNENKLTNLDVNNLEWSKLKVIPSHLVTPNNLRITLIDINSYRKFYLQLNKTRKETKNVFSGGLLFEYINNEVHNGKYLRIL